LELSLRGLVLLSAVTVLLSVSLVYSIRYEFTPKTNSHPSSAPIAYGVSEGLKVTLMLQKTEFSLGEPVNITLTVTNISNQTVGFEEFPSWWSFLVYNGTNNGLYVWPRDSGRGVPFYGTTVSLDPGIGFTDEAMVWPQMCNSTVDRYGAANSPVSPGTYYIVGQYFGYNLQTTPIQITIAQP
jgi:hypothetical protein